MTAESKSSDVSSGVSGDAVEEKNPYAYKILEVEGSAMAYGRHSKCLSANYFRFRIPNYVARHDLSSINYGGGRNGTVKFSRFHGCRFVRVTVCGPYVVVG